MPRKQLIRTWLTCVSRATTLSTKALSSSASGWTPSCLCPRTRRASWRERPFALPSRRRRTRASSPCTWTPRRGPPSSGPTTPSRRSQMCARRRGCGCMLMWVGWTVLCQGPLQTQNPFWSNFIKLATLSERQAPPIHARPRLGLAWIGGACLSETVASLIKLLQNGFCFFSNCVHKKIVQLNLLIARYS